MKMAKNRFSSISADTGNCLLARYHVNLAQKQALKARSTLEWYNTTSGRIYTFVGPSTCVLRAWRMLRIGIADRIVSGGCLAWSRFRHPLKWII